MTTNLFQAWQDNYQIDPALSDAFKRLMEAGKSASEDLELVSEAVTPMKDFMQINANVSGLFNNMNWFAAYQNFFQPGAYSKSFETFSELQEAALKKFTEGQTQLLNAITEDSQDILKAATSSDKPQQAIANYIDKSLDAYEGLKKEMLEQSKNVSSVNSAFMIWLQQTIENFGKAQASA